MSFPATKRELGELYTFFRLLADGKVSLGTPSAEASEQTWPVAMIQRIEHDGARRYYIEPTDVRIVYGDIDKHTSLFTKESEVMFSNLKNQEKTRK